jgi:tRNA dimethylallyltransferase
MAVFPSLIVILGPTASGKSALAMELARRMNGEILSVDSMQVYRGMDVGTAKPTISERAEVKHHLIDVINADQVFTVARFVELADQVISDEAARSIPLIATGGTPLYYKALFEGLFEGPGANSALREQFREVPNEELVRKLASVDPEAASRIHLNDTRRLIRALEVFELTGKPISSFQTDWGTTETRHRALWIGLDWDREILNRRINARVKSMLGGGWIEETRELLKRHGTLSTTAAEATGYRQLIDYVKGNMPLNDATEQIKIATRQLARKQMKWFRRWKQVHWLGGDQSKDELADQALQVAKI